MVIAIVIATVVVIGVVVGIVVIFVVAAVARAGTAIVAFALWLLPAVAPIVGVIAPWGYIC